MAIINNGELVKYREWGPNELKMFRATLQFLFVLVVIRIWRKQKMMQSSAKSRSKSFCNAQTNLLDM